ncbi:Os12g0204550, partial [Oryza sativa Japonica Group]
DGSNGGVICEEEDEEDEEDDDGNGVITVSMCAAKAKAKLISHQGQNGVPSLSRWLGMTKRRMRPTCSTR